MADEFSTGTQHLWKKLCLAFHATVSIANALLRVKGYFS